MTTTDTLIKDAAVNFRNEMVRIIRERTGMNEKFAVPLAEEIIGGLRAHMGGCYVPAREMREVRDAAVIRDFTGNNHAEVMHKHGISQATLYRIIGGK
jgi:Mor family transcriptional regulator